MDLFELSKTKPALEVEQADPALAAFITQLVAMSIRVPAAEIAASSRRGARACAARQIAMYLAHVACSWSLGRVALAFGRDRSTVSNACRRVEDMREQPALDALLDACEACVRAAPKPF